MPDFLLQVSEYTLHVGGIRLEWVSSHRLLSFLYRSDTVPHQSVQIGREQSHRCIGDVYWGD